MNAARKTYTRAYIVALGLIAMMSVGLHLTESQVVSGQAVHAERINIAGRQRMLSQQIPLRLAEYSLTEDQQRREEIYSEIERALGIFRTSHQQLSVGDLALKQASPQLDAVIAFYFDDKALDRRVRQFTGAIDAWLTDPASIVVPDTRNLLADLHAMVGLYELNAQEEVAAIRTRVRLGIIGILLVLGCEALFIFRPLGRKLVDAEKAIVQATALDPVTRCLRRHEAMSAGSSVLRNATRQGQNLSTIVVDIDNLRRINQRFGAAAGDAALKCVADRLRRVHKTGMVLGRIGDDSFALICADTKADDAEQLALRLRTAIVTDEVRHGDIVFSVSITFGVAALQPGETKCINELVDEAHDVMTRKEAAQKSLVQSPNWMTAKLPGGEATDAAVA